MTTRISIITVTLNAERFLPVCLASVTAQGDSLFEHIIVDGGSTDSTLDIIRNHAAHDSRVRWVSEPDNGISDAMNKGLHLATGDVVSFLHADDYFPDETVLASVCSDFNNRSGLVWLTGGLRLVNANGINLGEIRVRRFTYNRLMRGNIILHPATFIKRRSLLDIGGFDIRWKYAMDYDAWLRLGARENPRCVDNTLACFRLHSGSLSTVNIKDAFAEEMRIRQERLAGKPFLRTLYALFDAIKLPVTIWTTCNALKQAEKAGR